MTERNLEYLNRRNAMKSLAAAGTVAVAGCLGGDDDEQEPEEEEPDEQTTPEDEPGDEDEQEEVSDIQQLVEIFDDQPMNDAQHEIEGENRDYTPRHVWKFVAEESLIGLHFDEPNPEEANELDYITIGRKGLFTEESRPGPEFTHFHQHTADSWEGGHGGEEGDEGYWLSHIAVRDVNYPFHDDAISPRVDYDFMVTDPPEGSDGHSTDFESPGGDEGSLSAEDRDALLEVFDDRPHNNAQHAINGADYTPRHVWLEANDDVHIFLHFDEPNPEEANELDYFGIAVDGQFTVEDVPAGQTDEFTHFHLSDADSWEAGHGGDDTDDEGAWLVHHSVREIEYPFHEEPIDVSVDREFMPTPAPDA